MKRAFFLLVLLCLAVIAPLVRAQQAEQSEREAMYYRYLEFASYVKGGSIEPHWLADGSSFWYAEGAPANTVIWRVDPRANPSAGLRVNTKTPLFDTARLRQALTPLLGHEPPYQGLPFDTFTFVDTDEKAVKFTVEGKEFILQLDTYTITRAPVLSEEQKSRLAPLVPRTGEHLHQVLSPNARWFAVVNRDEGVFLRSTYDNRVELLITDSVKDYEWDYEDTEDARIWSPDSLKLVVKKLDSRGLPKIPIVHYLKRTDEVDWARYPKAGGPMRQTELLIVNILSKRQVRLDTGEEPDQHLYILGWRPDGSELLFLRLNRTLKRLDLMAAKPATGDTRVILTETQKTFVLRGDFSLLGAGERFIWASERDGWNHLYLYDLDGKLIRRLTEGAFPVLGGHHLFIPQTAVVAVDEEAGWVYFRAHGNQQRPYDTHLYRVNLEGKGFSRLTEATGQHDIQFAPSREFFLDTHSAAARPPVVELRSADGKLLQILSKANIEALKDLKWSPPEEFVVKAADGKTDLYGVLYKPYDFDPNKKYPVIEFIYAGPWTTWVPRSSPPPWMGALAQAWAQLGFTTFMVDARGTPGRSKEFQDVVYGNLGRNEISDHVATLKQLAEKRPYIDLGRVGIVGGSWGGYFALRAMLLAPEVYHVGVAWAPLVDLYKSYGDWAELYMGLPQNNREGYEYGSNLRLASNLRGKLLLIHGTNDREAPFFHTMKMVEALIRAGKPYDLIVLPDQGHFYTGTSRTYWLEAIRRYFQEHLKP